MHEFDRVIGLVQTLTERISETAFEVECAIADIENEAREEADEARRTELERRAEVLQEVKDLLVDAAGEVDHQIVNQPDGEELEAA